VKRADIDRAPSCIDGLDEIIGGGFPRGSLIVLAGNPGTGKTIFSASFLYHGIVDYDEKGVYISFAENKKAFFNNMRAFGFNFEELEKAGKFRFLDLITAREETAPAIIETILREVSEVGVRHLVIDSKLKPKARTLLIVENPHGDDRIGFGIEEFVADGIILLKRSRLADRLLRELEIFRMRGTPVQETLTVFTLKDGFKIFPPFKPKPIEKPSRFQPQLDTEECFSTGSQI